MAGKKIFGIRIMHVDPPMAPGKRYGKQSVKRWEPVLKPGSLKKALEEKAALAREQNQLERRLKTFKTAALVLVLGLVLTVIGKAQTYMETFPYTIIRPGVYILGHIVSGYSPPFYEPFIDVRSSNVKINCLGNPVVGAIRGLTGINVEYLDVFGLPVKNVSITNAYFVGFNRCVNNYAENTWITNSNFYPAGKNAIGITLATAGQYGLISSVYISGDGSPGQIGILNESNGNVIGFTRFNNLSTMNYHNMNNPSLDIPSGKNNVLSNDISN